MESTIVTGYQIDPIVWDEFVKSTSEGNIYHLHAYLSHYHLPWEAVLIKEGAEIIAAFPYIPNQKWGFRYAKQPIFSQYLGFLFRNKSEHHYKKFEFQKKAINCIEESLKTLHYLNLHFSPEFEYDLPLIWNGWKQAVLTTYWVDISIGFDAVLAQSASHVRREYKKANEAGFSVVSVNDPATVIKILKTAKPQLITQIPQHFFETLETNARWFYALEQSTCLIGYDGEKPIAGIIYFIYNDKLIYYQGSTLPEYKNAGIMTKIILDSVKMYQHRCKILDFDGSMMEPIERFFRGFGAYPVRYSKWWRYKNKWVNKFLPPV